MAITVSRGAVLSNIEAFFFFLSINPDTHHQFDDAEYNEGENKRESVN